MKTDLAALGHHSGVSFANKNVSGLQKYLRFQNEYNKVEIELRVVQFWTEIKLVITNRTPASRSCDFVITRLISVQIALHSVQLPLIIYSLRLRLSEYRLVITSPSATNC